MCKMLLSHGVMYKTLHPASREIKKQADKPPSIPFHPLPTNLPITPTGKWEKLVFAQKPGQALFGGGGVPHIRDS